MGIGEQVAPVANIAAFLDWADREGWRIGENVAYGGVTPWVHSANSWHKDTRRAWSGKLYSLAADLNYGPPGAPSIERQKAARACRVAQAFGLGHIFALRGTYGSAISHQGHFHVDCGSTYNLGDYYRRVTKKNIKVYRIQKVIRAERDNIPGRDFRKRLEAIKAASNFGGNKFPEGVKYVQRVVGTKDDGDWGPNSRDRHDFVVGRIQEILGLRKDYIWGPKTDAAVWALF